MEKGFFLVAGFHYSRALFVMVLIRIVHSELK